MTERVQKQLEVLQKREYRKLRVQKQLDITNLTNGKDLLLCEAYRLATMLEAEVPVLPEGDRMGFYRHNTQYPQYAGMEKQPGQWPVGNLTPNYGRVISQGFDSILQQIQAGKQNAFTEAIAICIQAILGLADRYRVYAKEHGYMELYEALLQVPHQGATNFLEACVFLKCILFTLRCVPSEHVTLGRFDQYMYPYYLADKQRGVSEDALLELVEEFFISINMDTDIYYGLQQGDNGQSLVLGGRDASGTDQYNGLSQHCMTASLELCLIDPKINLRVDKNTPLERFVYATRLTKQGLGFPQYSNDDIVIPGLVQLGYDYEDACNYTVAACWEFIVPNCGMDIPNICAMNFPGIIRQVMEEKLLQCDTFAQLMEAVEIGLQEECDRIIARCNQTTLRPAPYMSILIDGCLEQRQDVSVIGAKYNNYGVHGAGIANGADALAAVKMQVFDHKRIGKEELLQALAADFEGYVPLRNLLLESPKMGNNDEEADDIACQLMEMFASYLNHKPNGVGGIYRAGTGSAMEYIWSAETVGATADGRKAGAPYGSSFSPSLTTRLNGPLSVIQSFTKYDMRKIINGGPLTMEVHDATFRNEAGIEKVAGLVRTFILLGGHQLQLNAINRERLLDAQANPEKYPNLIVRVWGWSGYFRELDVPYQNHIIQRTEFTI